MHWLYKELNYREVLAEVAQLRSQGANVEVKLEPEPSNPFDAKAIAFQCKLNGAWNTIGYVVSDEVHHDQALSSNSIVDADY